MSQGLVRNLLRTEQTKQDGGRASEQVPKVDGNKSKEEIGIRRRIAKGCRSLPLSFLSSLLSASSNSVIYSFRPFCDYTAID